MFETDIINYMNAKQITLLGSLTYIFLMLLSLQFYLERVNFTDSAYHLFHILKGNCLVIQNYRYGALFTQAVPLLGSRLGVSLYAVASLYSASFILLPFAVFLVIILLFKNNALALAYLLFTILITTHTFYWVQSELPQGTALLFLYWGIVDLYRTKRLPTAAFVLCSLLLLPLTVVTHPLLIFGFCFLLFFYGISFPGHRLFMLLLGLSYALLFMAKIYYLRVTYDASAMTGLMNLVTMLPDLLHFQSNKNFLQYCLHDYYFLPIVFAICTIWYLRKKEKAKFLLLLLSTLGYILLVNCVYHWGVDQFYIENQYLLLAIFIGIPFALDVLPAQDAKLQLAIVVLICGISVWRIASAHTYYTNRLAWERRVLRQTEHLPFKKLIITSERVPNDTLSTTWACGYEFWLLSTIESANTRSVIIEEHPNEFDKFLPAGKQFISKWESEDYSKFNPTYFRFYDTTAYAKYSYALSRVIE